MPKFGKFLGRGGGPAKEGSPAASPRVKTPEQLEAERKNAANSYATMPYAGDELMTRISQQFKDPTEAQTVFGMAMNEREAKANAKTGESSSGGNTQA